jgi:hypothetical protein
VLGLSNFLTLQTFGARQNHLLRTNHPCIRPVSFAGVPLIELCLPALNAGTKFVAQGAAPFAGPEAFPLAVAFGTRDRNQLSILNSAHTKIAPPTLAESALPFLLDLKVFGISTYKNILRGAPRHESKPETWECCRAKRDCSSGRAGHDFVPARPEALVLRGGRLVACASPLECALTQKGGGGYRRKCLLCEKATHRMRFSRSNGQELLGATKSGERNTCGQKQIPRASALGMTTFRGGRVCRDCSQSREDARLKTPGSGQALRELRASAAQRSRGRGHLRPKADPSAKIRPRDDSLLAGSRGVASARSGSRFEHSAGVFSPASSFGLAAARRLCVNGRR